MTNLGTNFLEVLTREAVRLFPAPLAQMQRKRSQGNTGHMIEHVIFTCEDIMFSSESSPGISLVFT